MGESQCMYLDCRVVNNIVVEVNGEPVAAFCPDQTMRGEDYRDFLYRLITQGWNLINYTLNGNGSRSGLLVLKKRI